MSRISDLISRHFALCLTVTALAACTEAAPPEPGGEALDQSDEGIDEVSGALRGVRQFCGTHGDCQRGYVCEPTGCGTTRGLCVPAPSDCGSALRPQCGCDGVTYRNSCQRLRAGVAFHHRGMCDDTCGGIQGLTCDDDEVCWFGGGHCGDGDQQGRCLDRPEVCPDVWEPVCGCDGATYGNRCEAMAAGLSVRHPGACEVSCSANEDCDRGEFCLARTCGGEGICQRTPEVCTREWLPVCGCDGVTYGNECSAHRSGASIAYAGECRPEKCGGTTGNMCADDQFCELPGCDLTMLPEPPAERPIAPEGECVDVPEACPENYQPVCGCDGVSYSNDCFRRMAAVNRAHEGPCERPACWGNDECADREYCASATCGGPGRCVERPEPTQCQLVRDPVCGCDGVTYGNKCLAAATGANVAHSGQCVRECGGTTGYTCEAGEFCDPRAGLCAIAGPMNALVAPLPPPGMCVPVSSACPDVWAPVCGCDGLTYPSDCDRIQAKVAKLHDGTCEARRCEDNGGCGRAEWCAKSGCDGVGTCEPRPVACDAIYAPVCGCDGATYGNKCEAAVGGVNVKHEGECRERCGGIIGAPCESGEFCDLPPGTCDSADMQGVCVLQGDYCPLRYDPVCGCDGKTYSNDCFRVGAGVSKDHDGRCECARPACDIWCEFGYVLDDEGCATCRCNEPPIEACCDPNEKPGTNGNPFCFEGATCCSDGAWKCNDAGAQSTCGRVDPATDARPVGDGRICEACCDPAREPGTHGIPRCFEGASCCADGAWHCNDAMARPTCEVSGQVCECPALRCLNACYWGYRKDDNGCDTCECNPPPIEACCDPAREPGKHGNPRCGGAVSSTSDAPGATCCPDGSWQCDDANGRATCQPARAAAASGASSTGAGVVCEACCGRDDASSADFAPTCSEGRTCCPDGRWYCNDGDGSPTCATDYVGQVCCAPVVCTLACENGFATGPDGCEICQCNPRVCTEPPIPLCREGYQLVEWKDEHGCRNYRCDKIECPQLDCLTCEWGNKLDEHGCETCECLPPPCCDASRATCGPDEKICEPTPR